MEPSAMNAMPSRRMVWLALIFYLPMLGGAYFLRAPGLLLVADWPRMALGLGVACAAGAAVVAVSRVFVRRVAWGRALQSEFRAVLGPLSSWQILVLSLLSSFGEEILFRGVIHPRLGLWITALLFGAFHFPYRKILLPWSGFALVLGVVLGLLTDAYASLWPAIFLHFFINYFNLHDLAQPPPEGPGGEP